MTVSSGAISSIISITYWGLIISLLQYFRGCCFFQVSISRRQASDWAIISPSSASLPSSSASIPLSTILQSPTTGRSTLTFLLIEVGSMSIWMILALGANSSTFPVTRSSNRAPIAIRQSVFVTAMFAA